MEKDSLQLEWESIQDEIRNSVPEQPSVSVEKQYQSISQKRLINNNMIELILALTSIPAIGLLMLSLDSEKMAYLGWIKFSGWFASVLYLYPVIKLFRQIHYPDPTQQVTEYLQKLVNLMHYYKMYQVLSSFILCLIIISASLFFSQAWGREIDGVYYNYIKDMPSDYFWKFSTVIVVVSAGFSVFVSGWAYLTYVIFYKKRRKELKSKLDILTREN